MSDKTSPNPRRRRWRIVLGVAAIVVIFFVGRPVCYLTKTHYRDVDARVPIPPGFADDASRLSMTRVHEVWPAPADRAEAERQLVELLRRARAEKLPVSIAGARHSMGGHTIAPDGIVIDMRPLRTMALDAASGILRVDSGATWSEVLRYLNPLGRSVAVMQAFSSFSIGGSLSVNGHGWQHDQPPISSSVVSLRLMRADGTVARCSRTENAELFSLVLGGYGLFGIILDAEIRTVPDERYAHERFVLQTDQYIETYREKVANAKEVGLSYGRLRLDADRFLGQAILNRFVRVSGAPLEPMPIEASAMAGLQRAVFRGAEGNEYGKKLRWDAEARLEEYLTGRVSSRNQLLYAEVEEIANRSAASTDILQEYFLPAASFDGFVGAMREIVPRRSGDLINVTVRNVAQDVDTFLRYAEHDVFAFVLLFACPLSAEGDAAMEGMTRELVDAAIRLGGRYYLPYRLHATPEQLRAAYPQAREFFAKKREFDPEERFQNKFYQRYGR